MRLRDMREDRDMTQSAIAELLQSNTGDSVKTSITTITGPPVKKEYVSSVPQRTLLMTASPFFPSQ